MSYTFVNLTVGRADTWTAPADIEVVSMRSSRNLFFFIVGMDNKEYPYTEVGSLFLRLGDKIKFNRSGEVYFAYRFITINL